MRIIAFTKTVLINVIIISFMNYYGMKRNPINSYVKEFRKLWINFNNYLNMKRKEIHTFNIVVGSYKDSNSNAIKYLIMSV